MKWDHTHTDLMCLRQVSQRRNKEVEQAKTFLRKKDCEALVYVDSFNDVTAANGRIHARKLDVDFEGVLRNATYTA